jgi:hypothetical protein
MIEYVTTAKAAEMLGVSTSRVRQLILAGRLATKRDDGHDHWVEAASVRRFVRRPPGRPKPNGKKL